MIVANDISAIDAGFGVDTNRVSLLFPNAEVENLPLMTKSEVAEAIIAHVGVLLENR
jgi:phosphopantothenoylcysteine decarboxylase/phosphopantothenate--cysteine ligase